jgi:putative membrane protein insertion efficiency factor
MLLIKTPQNKSFLAKISQVLSKLTIWFILVYQKTISPDHSFIGRFFPKIGCKYYPSCSEYTKQAIQQYGVVKGGGLGIIRVLKCNPATQGGFDPLI